MNPRPLRLGAAFAPLGALAFLLSASSAHADDRVSYGPERVPVRGGAFALKIEPGVAVPLSAPQSRRFDVGGGQTVKALFALSPYWDLGPSIAFLALPAADGVSEAGTAWTFGGGVRFKRPHHASDDDSFLAISPWVDVDALYVRTAELNRPGFAAAVGLAVPLGHDRTFWLGPFVRYLQILQGTPSGFDNRDARILSVGLSLEVGSRIQRVPRYVAVTESTVEVTPAPAYCPDRDRDGVPDQVDRCPEVVGTAALFGCKNYEKLVLKPDKLELKEKLYFAWDQATIQEESFPALDEVVQALKDNPQFRVQVEGHSSSDGSNDHNQSLSSRRAEAVVAYLVDHGIPKERLGSKGFASSAPSDTNATAAGRENNRRVEFVVYFTILGDGAKTQ
jgi:outer membrane protein OmpA-like peptidoglycan-associated protein